MCVCSFIYIRTYTDTYIICIEFRIRYKFKGYHVPITASSGLEPSLLAHRSTKAFSPFACLHPVSLHE